MEYDILFIGAGHNALIAAAYAAQAGYRVGVFERRDIAGGAVSTRELFPGYQIDLGGSAHILIRLTPVVEELGLERYGLHYLELDPLFFSPFPDGEALFLYRDVDRTADHLEAHLPGQGEAYRRFIADWMGFSEAVNDVFLNAPGPLEIGKSFVRSKGFAMDWKRALPSILRPYGEVVRDYFSAEQLRAMLVWMAAQSGPPPTEPLTGPFLLWHPLYHKGGIARPRGGSGMLTQALQRHIEAHGGAVHLGAPVDTILVKGRRAFGIQAGGQSFTARAIVAGTHAVETFTRLLPEAHRPVQAAQMRVGNGFGAVVRLALRRKIQYTAAPGDEARTALQLLCRDTAQINTAYGDYLRGEPAGDPPLVAMSFSAVDDSLAPPGGEVLWLWAQYFPYQLRSGMDWDEIGDRVADRIIDTFEVYAPGIRDHIVGQLFQHPRWLERELGLFRGNVMHLEMSLDQMFMLRPFLGMARYRTHLKGLYLTGASTHPGGGIMGASGRNTARVLLQDLERGRL